MASLATDILLLVFSFFSWSQLGYKLNGPSGPARPSYTKWCVLHDRFNSLSHSKTDRTLHRSTPIDPFLPSQSKGHGTHATGGEASLSPNRGGTGTAQLVRRRRRHPQALADARYPRWHRARGLRPHQGPCTFSRLNPKLTHAIAR